MNGVDPYAYMEQVAVKMNELTTKQEIETVRDEMEYLFEVIPPDYQDTAEELISQLRSKLADAD